MGTRVYIGDLEESGDQRDIEEAFSRFGPVKEVWLAKDPKGFAFVEFKYHEDAINAIKEMDSATLCGCKVRVEMAREGGRRGRGGRFRGGFYPRTNSFRRPSPTSYRPRRDDRGPRRPPSPREYRGRDYQPQPTPTQRNEYYPSSRRDTYFPPPREQPPRRFEHDDNYSDYRGGQRERPPYERSREFRSPPRNEYWSGGSGGAGSYGGYTGSSGPRGYVGSAPGGGARNDDGYEYERKKEEIYREPQVRSVDRNFRRERSPLARSPVRRRERNSPY